MKSLFSNANIKSAAITTVFTILYALVIRLFLLPSEIITGGVTGLSLAIRHFTGFPVSPVLMILNLIFFVWGWLEFGTLFAANTLLSTVLYPAALAVFERWIRFTPTDDPLLCTVFSGIGIGFLLGMILRVGASTGGLDIPCLILNRRYGIPVSVCFYGTDILILLIQSLYSSPERILYGILQVMIYSFFLERVLLVGKARTQLMIISEKSEQIQEQILKEFDRGVTVFYGEGGFTRKETRILLSIVQKRELPQLERTILKTDPDCFLTILNVNEVNGRGFTRNKLYQ